jgi:hypothetical protein
VPAQNIATLVVGERAFDDTYTTRNGRQPGLIQMSRQDFLQTFAQYGNTCARTVDLYNRIPKDASGKPEPVSHWPADFQHQVATLQGDPLVSAQMGTMYAKTHPVQLDIVRAHMGETAARNQLQLGDMMRDVGHLSDGQTNLVLDRSDPEWCAATVDSGMAGAGIAPQRQLRDGDPRKAGSEPTVTAKDYDNFGTAIPHPTGHTVKPGDVVVFSFGHVALVNSVDPKTGNFTYLGGNQGRGVLSVNVGGRGGRANVSDSTYTFRRPPEGAFAHATANPLPETNVSTATPTQPTPGTSNPIVWRPNTTPALTAPTP